MRVRWLGWAGAEYEHDGETVVVDPLGDPGATFAGFGAAAGGVELPEVVAPTAGALAGLVSHLHRDHTDAGALTAALAPGAAVLHPEAWGDANLALAQAEHELNASELARRSVAVWGSVTVGPFICTALPAVDGLGDPQVSWLVEADGVRVLHLGDTLFHGGWWQMARRVGPFDVVLAPINGAVVDFPHQQPASPLPATMVPEQAALSGELLGAGSVIPMHYGGYAFAPHYVPVPNARELFVAAARGRPYRAAPLVAGESLAPEHVGASR
jgi:L-ascorbate metabolism protein UlaG (beta-lactamase superfamily)